jgi:hypothetical protein
LCLHFDVFLLFFLKKGDVGTVGFVEECGSGCGGTLASGIHSAESFAERWWEKVSSRRSYYSWFGRQEVVSLQKLVF